jgi:hypothetical protein
MPYGQISGLLPPVGNWFYAIIAVSNFKTASADKPHPTLKIIGISQNTSFCE